jgi:hypothetical protein
MVVNHYLMKMPKVVIIANRIPEGKAKGRGQRAKRKGSRQWAVGSDENGLPTLKLLRARQTANGRQKTPIQPLAWSLNALRSINTCSARTPRCACRRHRRRSTLRTELKNERHPELSGCL